MRRSFGIVKLGTFGGTILRKPNSTLEVVSPPALSRYSSYGEYSANPNARVMKMAIWSRLTLSQGQ